MLTLNNISAKHGSRKPAKRIGRGPGSGTGKTAGKGHKGQWARSGASSAPGFEGGQTPLYRRLPKVGFKSFRPTKWHMVNVGALEKYFEGSEVDQGTLKVRGLICGPDRPLRILGSGDLKKKFTVKANHFSKSAKEKIEAAGGKAEVVDGRS